MSDHAEITRLLTRYCVAIDERDFARLHDVFDDGAEVVYSDGVRRTGRQEIVAFLAETAGRVGATQHLLHTSQVDVDPGDRNRAVAFTHVTAHHVARSAALPALPQQVFTVTGTYRDRLVRAPAGWRIAERLLTLVTAAGDRTVLHP